MSRPLVVAWALAIAFASTQAASAAGLRTAIAGERTLSGPDAALAFARVRASGATVVRLSLAWRNVARTRPTNPTNPSDPAYQWAEIDRQVTMARSHGLEPIVQVDMAPVWAQGKPTPRVRPDPVDPRYRGSFRPSPVQFGRFARAAAARYSGRFQALPRVRLWQAWNEPNVSGSLMPQLVEARPDSPIWYRRMVNEFAVAVHGVHRDNVVIAGGLSPFTVRNEATIAVGPLRFMRDMLCLSAHKRPRTTCRERARFDVWAHHPYTSGGPTHRAVSPDDVSVGDLPEMRRLLQAAVAKRKVLTEQKMRFWVTEFSWDSKPPDPHPRTVPIRLHARWVAEALFRMWQSGVDLVTWFQLRDDAYPGQCCQSGLYFRGSSLARDKPKPALVAFRFPFVAFASRGRTTVWGRSPGGVPGTVVVERSAGKSWRRLAVLRTDRHGIFAGRVGRVAPPRPTRVTTAAATPYADAVVADAPISYWRLGERSGGSANDERGLRVGTYRGGVRLGVPGALRGDRNTAVTLDGRNDRVELGGLASPRTVELWLRTQSVATAAAFSNRNAISHYTFVGSVGAGNALAFDTLGLLGARWISDGRWHHLVYTYDGAAGRLYVDGVLDATARWARIEGGAPASLGYDATLRSYLRGSLDEVAIYDRPLSEADVKRHFRASGHRPVADEQFDVMVDRATYLRARLSNGSAVSLPFSLKRPRDRYVLPFGS